MPKYREGLLNKYSVGRTLGIRNWKERWFVVDGDGIKYYSKQADCSKTAPKGTISWAAVTRVRDRVDAATHPQATDAKCAYLGVDFKSENGAEFTLLLKAADPSDRAAWAEALLQGSGLNKDTVSEEERDMEEEDDDLEYLLPATLKSFRLLPGAAVVSAVQPCTASHPLSLFQTPSSQSIQSAQSTAGNGGTSPSTDVSLIPPTYGAQRRGSRPQSNQPSGLLVVLKSLVSKNKKRFIDSQYNLDLVYITNRIIAMGYPASGTEALYRNSMEDVENFFQQRHPRRHRIYNLCMERMYAKTALCGAWERFPFEDHHPPPLALIPRCLHTIRRYLEETPDGVVAIHCKAGKGRTGTIICSYLCAYENMTPAAALKLFGERRSTDGKGVTIPSQVRYIRYSAAMLNSAASSLGAAPPAACVYVPAVKFTRITLFRVKNSGALANAATNDIYFLIVRRKKDFSTVESGDATEATSVSSPQKANLDCVFDSRKDASVKRHERNDGTVEYHLPDDVSPKLSGDFKFCFYLLGGMLTSDHELFHFWLHSSFMGIPLTNAPPAAAGAREGEWTERLSPSATGGLHGTVTTTVGGGGVGLFARSKTSPQSNAADVRRAGRQCSGAGRMSPAPEMRDMAEHPALSSPDASFCGGIPYTRSFSDVDIEPLPKLEHAASNFLDASGTSVPFLDCHAQALTSSSTLLDTVRDFNREPSARSNPRAMETSLVIEDGGPHDANSFSRAIQDFQPDPKPRQRASLTLGKLDLDGAHKDKGHIAYDEKFSVVLNYDEVEPRSGGGTDLTPMGSLLHQAPSVSRQRSHAFVGYARKESATALGSRHSSCTKTESTVDDCNVLYTAGSRPQSPTQSRTHSPSPQSRSPIRSRPQSPLNAEAPTVLRSIASQSPLLTKSPTLGSSAVRPGQQQQQQQGGPPPSLSTSTSSQSPASALGKPNGYAFQSSPTGGGGGGGGAPKSSPLLSASNNPGGNNGFPSSSSCGTAAPGGNRPRQGSGGGGGGGGAVLQASPRTSAGGSSNLHAAPASAGGGASRRLVNGGSSGHLSDDNYGLPCFSKTIAVGSTPKGQPAAKAAGSRGVPISQLIQLHSEGLRPLSSATTSRPILASPRETVNLNVLSQKQSGASPYSSRPGSPAGLFSAPSSALLHALSSTPTGHGSRSQSPVSFANHKSSSPQPRSPVFEHTPPPVALSPRNQPPRLSTYSSSAPSRASPLLSPSKPRPQATAAALQQQQQQQQQQPPSRASNSNSSNNLVTKRRDPRQLRSPKWRSTTPLSDIDQLDSLDSG
ncbi:Phosphatidylinositol 3 [Diplonema papillatum]|nr:Phosphatidylinositol 3 [Diplonema papillatum]